MIKKKLFSLALASVLAVSLMFPAKVLADGSDKDQATGMSAKISTSSGSFIEGDTVTTDVSIANSPNLNSLEIEVTYDATALEYKTAQWTSALDYDDAASLYANNGVLLLSLESETGFSIGGTLASLEFKALKNGSEAPVAVVINAYTSDADDFEEDEEEEDGEAVTEEVDDTADTGQDDTAVVDDTTVATDDTNTAGSSASYTPSTTSTRSTSSGKTDRSYKTGVILGKELFLVVAAGAGILAGGLAFLTRRKKD